MRTEGFAFLLVRPDRQNLHEHGRAVCALHARADKNGKIYQTKLRARCKASPVIRTNKKCEPKGSLFLLVRSDRQNLPEQSYYGA